MGEQEVVPVEDVELGERQARTQCNGQRGREEDEPVPGAGTPQQNGERGRHTPAASPATQVGGTVYSFGANIWKAVLPTSHQLIGGSQKDAPTCASGS